MKKSTLLLGLATIGFATFTSVTASAQSDVGDFVLSKNTQDVTRLCEAYLNPVFNGFSTGLNSGWNNTAKTKKFGRFEIRVSASGALIPSSDKTFDITQIGLSPNIRPTNLNNVTTPTAAGGKNGTAQVDLYTDNGTQIKSGVSLPEGLDIPGVPAPQIQATLGLPLGIDATLRLVPSITVADKGSIRMIGGGLKVNVMQLFNCKKLNKITPFDLAIAGGYTEISYDLSINDQRPDQKLTGKVSGWNTEAIISKKLSFFTPFVSVGYNTSKINLDLKGNYEVEVTQGSYQTITNPVSINKEGITGLRANMGFQLELFILRLYASYSVAKYNSVNAGVGIGI